MDRVCFADVTVESVFEAAFEEARQHRWIESQNCGRDLGDWAIYDWYRQFWPTFLRHRHVEHLVGERWWAEFSKKSYGVLRETLVYDVLANDIVDLYRNGEENLTIIKWALDEGHDLDEIVDSLLLINMNDARLDPRFQ